MHLSSEYIFSTKPCRPGVRRCSKPVLCLQNHVDFTGAKNEYNLSMQHSARHSRATDGLLQRRRLTGRRLGGYSGCSTCMCDRLAGRRLGGYSGCSTCMCDTVKEESLLIKKGVEGIVYVKDGQLQY